MQCGQGRRFADAVPQPHEIDDCASRVVDARVLAWGCLQAGQAQFEGRGLETEYRGWRERDLRWPACPGHGDLNGSRDLVCQVVHCGGRHQACDCGRVPRYATASRSGKLAGAASLRRNTPWESSRMSPASRAAYRSRGWSPEARAVAVVNVGGRSAISTMDRSASPNTCPCDTFIHVFECRRGTSMAGTGTPAGISHGIRHGWDARQPT